MRQILFIPFLFFYNCLSAQNKLSGNISDKQAPISDVAVLLYRGADSVMLKSTITDSVGRFGFEDVSIGRYFLKTYHARYRDTVINISSEFLSGHLPLSINLAQKSEVELKEVSVTYKKPLIERKGDRLVFNLENSIASVGGDALDALSKTPGVRVNNENISIVGKSSVRIMVNDRLLELSGGDLVNYLKTLSADDISAIEVITNPSAKYDAEGNSGIINLRLKKNSKEGWTIGFRASYIQATYPNAAGGATFDYKKNKLTLHSNLSGNEGATAPLSQLFVFYPQQSWYQTDQRKDYAKNMSGQAGIDYQLSKNSVAGISYSGSSGRPDMKEGINTPIYNAGNILDSSLRTSAFTNRKTAYQSVDAYYQCKLDTAGKKISVDANYSVFFDSRDKAYTSQTFDDANSPVAASYKQYKSDGTQQGDIFTLKADADIPMKNYALSFGGKMTVINNTSGYSFYNSVNGYYIPDTTQSNNFFYTEQVQALYASIDKTIEKWEIQAGLRGELTETKAYSPTLDFTSTSQYFKVFPTFNINFKNDDNNTFSLNYGRRIDRPSYWDLNPFKWYFNQYSTAQGNPYLQPSYNNNLELDYNYKDFLTVGVYYSLGTNLQDRILVVSNSSDTQTNIIRNFLTTNSYGLNFTYIFNKLKWLESNNQFQLFYTQSVSDLPETIHILHGMSEYLSSSNSIMLNMQKTISGEVNFWYQFAGIDGVDKSSRFYNLDIGLKLKTLHKKMEISAAGGDIFRRSTGTYYTSVNGISQVAHNYFDSRVLRLTIKYKFGNDQLKPTAHQAGNQEEAGRIK